VARPLSPLRGASNQQSSGRRNASAHRSPKSMNATVHRICSCCLRHHKDGDASRSPTVAQSWTMRRYSRLCPIGILLQSIKIVLVTGRTDRVAFNVQARQLAEYGQDRAQCLASQSLDRRIPTDQHWRMKSPPGATTATTATTATQRQTGSSPPPTHALG
jgi:hypothetical protein